MPAIELPEVVGDIEKISLRLPSAGDRHAWSLGVPEQLIVEVLVQVRHCLSAFEIGTFNGGTTRLMAETLPDEGRVWTIDLPPEKFAATQAPDAFAASAVGIA